MLIDKKKEGYSVISEAVEDETLFNHRVLLVAL